MNKKSLTFSITLAFVALFFFLLIAFLFALHNIEKKEHFTNTKRAFEVARFASKEKLFLEYIKESAYIPVQEPQNILANRAKKVLWHDQKRRVSLTLFSLEDSYYLHILSPRTEILLRDDGYERGSYGFAVSIFLALFFAFALLYLRIIKKLAPLKQLQQSLQALANEQFDTELAIEGEDEIAALGREFLKSAKSLKALKESRNVFIRNIMHELKTPIAKGQILTQLPCNTKNQHTLQNLFYRLEALINEFATIEALITSHQKLTPKHYQLSDIVENAIDILMCEEEQVVIAFENIELYADFKLFSIALKNLLDNAIKYSLNHQATLYADAKSITIVNAAPPLQEPLEFYFEPFASSHQELSKSFGLGLYIIKHILDAHQFKLSYRHDAGLNHFTIWL